MSAILDDSAVFAVVEAALAGRPTVVGHSMSRDQVGGDDVGAELLARLPRSWIRAVDGAVDPIIDDCPAELGPVLPTTRGEATVTRVYHVQESSRYREFTAAIYDPMETAWPATESWWRRDAGFFVTSAGAVTPAHADRHHNLLLQISGRKEIGLCPPGSRSHANAVARSLPTLRVSEMPDDADIIDLHPGSALYMPPYTLHWVRSLDESLALSCGWSTEHTVRAGEVHAANAALLRLHIPAQPVGSATDRVKVRGVAAVRRIRARLASD
jgi:hypothetical protein